VTLEERQQAELDILLKEYTASTKRLEDLVRRENEPPAFTADPRVNDNLLAERDRVRQEREAVTG
jgi:hypothetical protein